MPNAAGDYTGPLERWWAPYDNRPGTLPTRALPGYSGDSFLWEFVGRDARIFHCPEGVDRTASSPTNGEFFQIAYALNPAVGGKRLGDLDVPVLLIWEHDDLPTCQSADVHWVSWPTTPEQRQQRHSPGRHIGMANVLFKDGSVAAHQP